RAAEGARQAPLARGERRALRGQAADTTRGAAGELAARTEPAHLGADAAGHPHHRAVATITRRVRANPSVRCAVHRAVGAARAQVRPRGATRRGISELALHRAAPRPLLRRRTQAAGRGPWIRGLPSPVRAAWPR